MENVLLALVGLLALATVALAVLAVWLVTRLARGVVAEVRAGSDATVASVLDHLRRATIVGGRPLDLERRAFDIAEEKNRLEKERLALERERRVERARNLRNVNPEG